MAKSQSLRQLWNPVINGLSVSGLELWLVDRVAFECSYLRDLEAVEPWNKNMQFGTLVQAGIEGFIKTRQARGAGKLIANEFEKHIALYSETEEISFWTKLATQMVNTWISLYAKDLDTYGIKHSERHHEMMLELPSGRSIKLHGYVDGEGDDCLMENKCRGEWDETKLAEEIDLNLQVNMYCLFHKAQHGKLPSTVWYQHMRRPAGFAYRVQQDAAKRLIRTLPSDSAKQSTGTGPTISFVISSTQTKYGSIVSYTHVSTPCWNVSSTGTSTCPSPQSKESSTKPTS
jgi:hypothetical protein